MKKGITILALLLAIGAVAQSDRYTTAMKKNLSSFDSSKTTADFQSLAASFERIGDAEKNQWLPYYYAGLALSIPAWVDTKLDKDANSQKIIALCDKADAIEKTSEIYEIRNMAATQQMMVDPQTRWTSYGQQASQALQKGLELNPSNPRLHYLQGQSVFNTPEQFGGGKAKAKPIFEKSVALFKSETVKPLYPQWGKKEAEDMLAQCQE
jgi:hypothetical protein